MGDLWKATRRSIDTHGFWKGCWKIFSLCGIIFLISVNFLKQDNALETFSWLGEFDYLANDSNLGFEKAPFNLRIDDGINVKILWTVTNGKNLEICTGITPKALKQISGQIEQTGAPYRFRVSNLPEPLEPIIKLSAEDVAIIKQSYETEDGRYWIITSSNLRAQFSGYNAHLCQPLVWLKIQLCYCFRFTAPLWILLVAVTIVEALALILTSNVLMHTLCLAVMFMISIFWPERI